MHERSAYARSAAAHLTVADALRYWRIPCTKEISAEAEHVTCVRDIKRWQLLASEAQRIRAAQDFVTEQLDEGPVILQDVFHISVGSDTLDDVKRKGLDLEARVLSKAVQLYLDEELVVVEGKVIFKPGIARFFDKGATKPA